mmetsp:Transcript_28024/g.80808  ORF Transcript_28024/g.80808 Transcript_28024/m.80808 type:complete len:105 (-) Transcript_28024:60-374(-)
MADAPPSKEEGDGGKEAGKAEEDNRLKLCFFGCLDVIATIVRGCIAAWSGFKWVARRAFYPIKEVFFACHERWKRWYRPYLSKKGAGPGVSSFGYGHGVPDFQY